MLLNHKVTVCGLSSVIRTCDAGILIGAFLICMITMTTTVLEIWGKVETFISYSLALQYNNRLCREFSLKVGSSL